MDYEKSPSSSSSVFLIIAVNANHVSILRWVKSFCDDEQEQEETEPDLGLWRPRPACEGDVPRKGRTLRVGGQEGAGCYLLKRRGFNERHGARRLCYTRAAFCTHTHGNYRHVVFEKPKNSAEEERGKE